MRMRFPTPSLPKCFTCPRCGDPSVTVAISREYATAHVRCGKCKLEDEMPLSHIFPDSAKLDLGFTAIQKIDVYAKMIDRFYGALKIQSFLGDDFAEICNCLQVCEPKA